MVLPRPFAKLNTNTKSPVLAQGLGRTGQLCACKLPKAAVKVKMMKSV
jgi:hypothetical protein